MENDWIIAFDGITKVQIPKIEYRIIQNEENELYHMIIYPQTAIRLEKDFQSIQEASEYVKEIEAAIIMGTLDFLDQTTIKLSQNARVPNE